MTISLDTLMKRSFPKEMTDVPLWLIYKLIDKGNGKFGKPPVSPFSGEVCSKADEGMFTDFDRALAGVEMHDADGVGFVCLHGFMGIDLDDCFKDDGTLTEMAQDIVDHFIVTYIEYSPSGNGLHIFCQGTKPNDRTRVPGVEVYTGYNFVTVTGDHVDESGDRVLNMQKEIDWLFEKYLPTIETAVKPEAIVIDHGDKSTAEWLDIGLTHDDKLHRLYNDTDHEDDESSHDMALLCKLAYWLNRDIEALEQVFLDSPWVNSKDRRHLDKVASRSDYLENSIIKAVSMTTTTAADNDRKVKNISDVALRLSENSEGEILLPLHDYTDVGNARAFAELFSQELCYTSEWGWCYYCGSNWELAQEYRAQQCAVEFAENVMYIAKEYWSMLEDKCSDECCTPDSREGKEIMAPAANFMNHAKKTNSEKGIRAMLKLAEGMMKQPASLFDSNGWELNTPNVVVDLRTGETYPPMWNHFNSQLANIVYDPNAENNGMWDEFLNRTFCDDQSLIDYMQVQMGAACVGKVYEENLLIATGSGSNGKSTLFSIMKAVLGDYCTSVNPDILMSKVNYEQQIAIAQIKGKRLVIGQETESGQVLSTASVKRMVSSDTMIGRVLNHGYIEFEPTHSTLLATNHLPKVKDNDEGTWRRLTVIPFNATITRDEMITNFQDVLIAEDGAYILKWLVDGAITFYENGCTYGEKPPAVRLASNKYRETQREFFDQYVDERLVIVDPLRHPNTWSNPNEIYQDYVDWCVENNITKPLSKILLSRKLGERGVKAEQKWIDGKTVRMWKYVTKQTETLIEG